MTSATGKPKIPAKRWRVTTSGSSDDYTSERKAYDRVNAFAAIGTAAIGLRVTVHHFEDGRWVLYERVVITENGWEPA